MHLRRSPGEAAVLALVALGLLSATPRAAGAAGFALFEQGARGMGFAGAFTAQASDPSAIFHNAAGIAFLRDKEIYLGGTLIAPSTDFTGDDPFPGSGRLETMDVGVTPSPALYYTQRLNGSTVVGIGFNVPFGLRTEWASPSTFTGRFLSQKAELNGFSLNPTVAYKLADRLAIGVGLDVRRSSVRLERHVPLVNPFTQKVVDVASVILESDTDTAFGFNLGVRAKPSESLSIGISYRHRVTHEYEGGAAFTLIPTGSDQLDAVAATRIPSGVLPVSTRIQFPSILSLGAAYTWNDWTLEGDVNFYEWSTFDTLPLEFEGRADLSSTIEENYENSRQYRFGLERQIGQTFAVRGGYFYDQSPSPTESVSPLLPDASRHGFCLGASWMRGPLRLDAGVWYVKLKERSTEGLERDNFNGTYSGNAKTLGVSLGYVF
jgi:long-chain fatty acid transport protein